MDKKPEILYHASSINNLLEIQPKRTVSKDTYIGDYVFATHDKILAAMYLAPRQAGAKIMHTSSKPPLLVINSTPEIFHKYDQGGAIYFVSSETFSPSPQKELGVYEMVSDVAVKPLKKEVYKSSFEVMREMKIKIYFVDKIVFKSLHFTSDKKFKQIISGLKPFIY